MDLDLVWKCGSRRVPLAAQSALRKSGNRFFAKKRAKSGKTRAFGDSTETPKALGADRDPERRAAVTMASSSDEHAPRGELTVRLAAMPRDTNANGDIFGGWVISQMDQAGGIRAAETAQGRVVTIAIEAMTFIRPVRVGDVLSVYTALDHIGRTSLKIHIEAWAQRFRTHHREKVTDATFTFVAIGADGRPRPVVPEA